MIVGTFLLLQFLCTAANWYLVWRYYVLLSAVKQHRDASMHARCWLNDLELYKAAGLSKEMPVLPPESEFLTECKRYYREQNGN